MRELTYLTYLTHLTIITSSYHLRVSLTCGLTYVTHQIYPGWGRLPPAPSGIPHPEFPRIKSMAITVTII